MEQIIMDSEGIQYLPSQIGCQIEDIFIVSTDCIEALETLCKLLGQENPSSLNCRHLFDLMQLVPRTLIPLLTHLDDKSNEDEDTRRIFSLTVQALMLLSLPMDQSPAKHPVNLINKDVDPIPRPLLESIKAVFLDSNTFSILLSPIQDVLAEAEDGTLSSEDIEIVNNCLLLVRNILYMPNQDVMLLNNSETNHTDVILLRLLFQAGFAEILLKLMSMEQHSEWSMSVVQVILLLYRGQGLKSYGYEQEGMIPNAGLSTSSVNWQDSRTFDTDEVNSYTSLPPGPYNNDIQSWSSSSDVSEQGSLDKTSLLPQPPSDSGSSSWSPWHATAKPLSDSTKDFGPPKQSKSDSDKADENSRSDVKSGSRPMLASSDYQSSPGSASGSGLESSSLSGSGSRLGLSDDMSLSGADGQTISQGGSGGSDADGSNSYSYGSEDEKLDEHMQYSLMELETRICFTLNELKVRQDLAMLTEKLLENGGLNNLVSSLTKLLAFCPSTGFDKKMGTIYYLWLISRFLGMARNANMPFTTVSACLNVDVVSFLTYIGIDSCEQILVQQRCKKDCVLVVNSLHLVIQALKEIFYMVERLLSQNLSGPEQEYIRQLTVCMVQMENVRSLLLLVIRHYQPHIHSLSFLRIAILTNHWFLLLAEQASSIKQTGQACQFDMLEHVKSFATREVMSQYGRLLDNLDENSLILNDCIFTMMHHVAGDCRSLEALIQQPILKAFSDIWDNKPQLPKECSDLIHYTLQQFLNLAEQNPYECALQLFGRYTTNSGQATPDSKEMEEGSSQEWADDEYDELFMVYQQLDQAQSMEAVSYIVHHLAEKGIHKTNTEVLQQLCQQNLWSPEQLSQVVSQVVDLPCVTDMDCSEECTNSSVHGLDEEEEQEDINEAVAAKLTLHDKTSDSVIAEMSAEELREIDIQKCVQLLSERGQQKHLAWLQHNLLEICYVKLGGRKLSQGKYAEEPVALHYILQNKSVPVVAFSESHEQVLNDPLFTVLFDHIGLHMPGDTGNLFPRVPHFWSPDTLLHTAKKLAPINFSEEKFTEEDVKKYMAQEYKVTQEITRDELPEKEVQEFSAHNKAGLWEVFVQQCNIRRGSEGDTSVQHGKQVYLNRHSVQLVE